MSLFASFTKFFQATNQPDVAVPIEADRILPYLFSLINNEVLIQDEMNRFKKAQVLPPHERELTYIPIYIDTEHVILSQQPPIVKDSFSKASLRAQVSSAITVSQLSKAFQILFVPEQAQVLTLFEMGIDPVITYMVTHLGHDALQTLLAQASEGTFLSGLQLTQQGISYGQLAQAITQVSVSNVLTSCQHFFRVLYDELSKNLGEHKAESILLTSYTMIKSLYGYEFSSVLLDMLPGGILQDERMQLVSRQELERRITEATKSETERRQLSEQLAKELQTRITEIAEQNAQLTHTKEAMVTLLQNARQLETALQTERDRAQAIINSMGEGMITIDSSLRISFMNPVAEKLLGLAKTQAIGNLLTEMLALIYDPTGEEQTGVLSQAMQQGIKTVFHLGEHFLMKGKNNATFPVSLTLTPLPAQNGAVLLFHDRTAERLVKEKIEQEVALRTRELIEEQAKLTASINSLNRGFIMTDPGGVILLTNTVLNTMLGVIRTPWTLELVQKKLSKSVDVIGAFTTCVKDKQPILLDKVQFGNKFLRLSINPFFLPDYGTFLGIVIQLEDITDDVMLQRTRDEFFSIASHELRTPLTSIRGNVALIKQFYPQLLKDQVFFGMVEDIHDSSVRLIKIVNDFLNLSRLELGKIVFKRELFDLVPFIRSTAKEIDELITEKKLTFSVNTGDLKQAFVYADKDRLKEVIINLLSNSIKYTDKGTITITIARTPSGIAIQVADTGRGIPLKNQPLLFRKFQQASDNIITRDSSQSTGLGLYISKLLVQGMGGEIFLVSSEENGGATFQINLPVPD